MMKIIKQIKTSYVQNLRKVESERPTLVLIRLKTPFKYLN